MKGKLHSRWDARVSQFFRLGSRRHTIAVSCLVGVLCGLAAVLLKHTVHWTHSVVLELIKSPLENLLLLLLPAIGVLLSYLFVRYLVRDDIGHGVTQILYAISMHKGKIRFHNTYSSIIASSITIGFGGSVGAESPIVMTGSAIGSNIGRWFKMDNMSVNLMVGCGAAAGIAAIFKAPLAGMVFTLEVLMLDMTMSSIVPLLVSAVSATLVSYLLSDDGSLFHFVYTEQFVLSKSPYYVLLGVFTGFISVYFTRVAMATEAWFHGMSSPVRRIGIGALMLGALISLFPPLYGEGYDSVQHLFAGHSEQLFTHSPLAFVAGNEWLLLLALLLVFMLKVVAMSATTGAGGVGGSFAPTLFVGGVAGYFLARLLNVGFDLELGEANFVLVGMAGAMAGVMHAPLLGIFLIAELTEGYVLLIPLMMTATVAYITVSTFDKHSIYTKRLAARGELITHHKDRAVLTMMQLQKVIETDLIVVHPEDSLRELVRNVARSSRNLFPVVSAEGVLIGIVKLDDVRTVMFEQQLYDTHQVREYMSRPPAVIEQDDPMNRVMQKFEETKAWNLPVVNREGGYVGLVSKSKIFNAYRELLVQVCQD